MKRKIENIRGMISKLREHEEVHLIRAHVAKPATGDDIAAAEKAIGAELPDELRSFYKEANGVSVLWTVFGHPQFENSDLPEFRDGLCEYSLVSDLDNALIGSLAIPPVELLTDPGYRAVFETADLEDQFQSAQANNSLLGKLSVVPFDMYYFYNAAAAVWGDDGKGYVIIGDDHCASWTDFRASTIEAYLDFVVSNWGSIEARADFFGGYNAVRDNIIESYDEEGPELDEVIEEFDSC